MGQRRTGHRKVYISASATDDTEQLQQVLDDLGFEVLRIAPSTGAPVGTAVIKALGQADLVVVVMPSLRGPQGVYIEAGAALALEKPTLIISPGGTRKVPPDLWHLPTSQASLANPPALRLAIERAIAPAAEVGPERVPDSTRALGSAADEILKELAGAVTQRDATAFENTLIRALRSAGLTTGSQAIVGEPDKSDRADFVGWADSLEQLLGNPFLIEIKIGDQRADDLRAVQRLNSDAGVRTTLVLVGDERATDARVVDPGSGGSLLALNAFTLVRELRTQTLAEAVTAAAIKARRPSSA